MHESMNSNPEPFHTQQTPVSPVASVISSLAPIGTYQRHNQINIQQAESAFHQAQNIVVVWFFYNQEQELDAKTLVFGHDNFVWQDVRKVLSCLQDYELFLEKPLDSISYH